MGKHKGVRIQLHRGAVNSEILRNSAVAGMVSGIGASMAAKAGPGYASRATVSKRVGCLVYPATKEARLDNEQNNSLAKQARQSHKAWKEKKSQESS